MILLLLGAYVEEPKTVMCHSTEFSFLPRVLCTSAALKALPSTSSAADLEDLIRVIHSSEKCLERLVPECWQQVPYNHPAWRKISIWSKDSATVQFTSTPLCLLLSPSLCPSSDPLHTSSEPSPHRPVLEVVRHWPTKENVAEKSSVTSI